MSSMPDVTPTVKILIDRILESAVIVSWKEMLSSSQGGLIQIEYVPGTHLSYLKIWQLTGKGEWSLVYEHWTSHRPEIAADDETTFSNGYHSTRLAGMLQVIMQHESNFEAALRPCANSIQVQLPTEQETLEANACMRLAYESFGLAF